jgi:hypothetical protein
MRITITLDPDTVALVRRLMRERGLSLSQAVNATIRAGAPGAGRRRTFGTPTFDMGLPAAPVEHAQHLMGELEDEEVARKVAARR